ncbi:HD-GYP domain-containing protein [Paenibacillus sp. JX-17]|uniref:HD-GYP domain-containing protein n=1 Tax=Paenibacillus lacisoli TaxID=3064525 RepID=A0ABT9CA62_9BACL|nr:HD-GYP domain-containing protein [Paenibacillus sp. JX-17]MDO7906149.1 HD-GYP domain-containing protein [Paenibacillus sp. JX-17]
MDNISILQLKPGYKLAKDVHTELGGLVLAKGTVLLPRDLEVLRAFLIQHVEIESEAGEGKGTVKKETVTNSAAAASSFEQDYDKMIALTKAAFQSSVAAGVPILELRTQLETLFKHLNKYNILTFQPYGMKEDDYRYHNAVTVSLTSYLLAQWSGLPQKDWMQVALAGLLHDIGNVKVDPLLLHKPAPLTQEEQEEIRQHTTYGYQLLKNAKAINEGVRLTALQHHEKVDGSGYPLGLDGTQIHTYAKVVSVADIFHAMTLEKAYRRAQSPYIVLEQLHTEAFGKLDPTTVQIFINKVTQLSNGTKVRLSNEEIGEIVFVDRDHPTRPWINVKGQIVNLTQQRNLHIKEIITSS